MIESHGRLSCKETTSAWLEEEPFFFCCREKERLAAEKRKYLSLICRKNILAAEKRKHVGCKGENTGYV
jgi:hypothetical protein